MPAGASADRGLVLSRLTMSTVVTGCAVPLRVVNWYAISPLIDHDGRPICAVVFVPSGAGSEKNSVAESRLTSPVRKSTQPTIDPLRTNASALPSGEYAGFVSSQRLSAGH